MQKYISLFFSVLLFAACKPSATTPPNVIDEQRMIRLLTDLHIADGELYAITPVPDTLYKYGREKYLTLFKAYQVTEKQFDDSFKYYSQDPAKIQGIYENVDKILKAKLDSVRAVKPKPGQPGIKTPPVANTANPTSGAAKIPEVDTVLQKKKLKEGLDSLKRSARKRLHPNPPKSQK
ncbi:MAG: DUF4296 domain-containing protein [Mucilaginibacter sp.]|nr:DUF4296 domain-containing protein [Mucilaginibacter sp.]